MTFLAVLQAALAREDGVVAQRAFVGRVLASLGYREPPEQRRVSWDGRGVVLHVWRGTPAGDLALVGGEVRGLDELEEVGGELKRKVAEPPVRIRQTRRPQLHMDLPLAAWARVKLVCAPIRADIDAYPTVGLGGLQVEEIEAVREYARGALSTMSDAQRESL